MKENKKQKKNRNGKKQDEGRVADMITGRNPVMEALRSGRRIEKIVAAKGGKGYIKDICSLAEDKGVTVLYRDRKDIDESFGAGSQGIVAFVEEFRYSTLDEILEAAREKGQDPFVVICDGIEDPQNMGAIIRSAECGGAHGVIIGTRNSAPVTAACEKASAGAVEYMKVARVTNISATIDRLKEEGLWIGACDMDGERYTGRDLTGPVGLVVGSEGKGIRRLVRESCDFVLSIPMEGRINSLNASAAAAILIYEVRRQRDGE